MKRFIAVVTIILLMAPVTALSQSDWNALITQSGATGYSVEGATKIDVSTAKKCMKATQNSLMRENTGGGN